jgi:hypothetical protein
LKGFDPCPRGEPEFSHAMYSIAQTVE